MANPNIKDYGWKKGQSGNPSGRPKGLLTRAQVEIVFQKLANKNRAELQKVIDDPKSTMLEIMVASVVVKAATHGDASRVQFLLDRAVGKVIENIEVNLPKPTVIEKLDGSRVIAGIVEPEKIEGE